MKFLKAITPAIKSTIRVKAPDGEQVFDVYWTRPTEDQRLALIESINAASVSMTDNDPTSQAKAIRQYYAASRERITASLMDWEITDDQGKKVPFSAESRDEMLQWTEYRAPLDKSLIDILRMDPAEASAGNSLPPDGTLPDPTAAAS